MTNPNLFTFNPFSGISAGIHLVLNGTNPRNNRPVPLHIACGPAFVAVETGWKHPTLDRNGRLHQASLHYIEPLSGAKSFEVLVPMHEQETKLYCLVDSIIPKGVKLKSKPEEVRARFALETSEGVRMVIWDKMTQSYLLEFSADGDEVDIWYETGHIARIVRRGGSIIQIPLTATEIAQERVWQFEDQISGLQDGVEADQKRRHGIIAGSVRLLRNTSDRDAEDRLVDFLVEQIPHLTEGLRTEIRSVLLAKGHSSAGDFTLGWPTNVVQLKPKSSDGKARSAARKRLRAEEDRARTMATKGASGGGGGKKRK
jgi:hypothetical protein